MLHQTYELLFSRSNLASLRPISFPAESFWQLQSILYMICLFVQLSFFSPEVCVYIWSLFKVMCLFHGQSLQGRNSPCENVSLSSTLKVYYIFSFGLPCIFFTINCFCVIFREWFFVPSWPLVSGAEKGRFYAKFCQMHHSRCYYHSCHHKLISLPDSIVRSSFDTCKKRT